MDATTWAEIQEGILYTFGPVLFWFLVLVVAGGVLSALGAVILAVTSNMTG